MNTQPPTIDWSLYWFEFIRGYNVPSSLISSASHTTVELIRSHPEYPWDFYYLCENHNIMVSCSATSPSKPSWDTLKELYEISSTRPDDITPLLKYYMKLFLNHYDWTAPMEELDDPSRITLRSLFEAEGLEFHIGRNEIWIANEDNFYYGRDFSRNPHYTLDVWKGRFTEPFEVSYYQERRMRGLEIHKYLENPSLTWDDILYIRDTLKYPFLEGKVGHQLCITWSIIKENPDFPFDWFHVSRNPNITMKIVKENPETPWDMEGLSSNPSICWADVIFHPEYEWSPRELSSNPNITMEIVRENPSYPWNYRVLIHNKMTVSREAFYEEKRRREIFREEIFPEYASVLLRPREGIYGRLVELGLIGWGGGGPCPFHYE